MKKDLKKTSKKTRVFHCPGCQQKQSARGLCAKCLKLIDIGRHFDNTGYEFVQPEWDRGLDMNGLQSFVIYGQPLVRFTNWKREPKAIAIGNTWYARIDSAHALHSIFENEFKSLTQEK